MALVPFLHFFAFFKMNMVLLLWKSCDYINYSLFLINLGIIKFRYIIFIMKIKFTMVFPIVPNIYWMFTLFIHSTDYSFISLLLSTLHLSLAIHQSTFTRSSLWCSAPPSAAQKVLRTHLHSSLEVSLGHKPGKGYDLDAGQLQASLWYSFEEPSQF